MWKYQAFRFPSKDSWDRALIAIGWQNGAPPWVSLMEVGNVYVSEESEEAFFGWHIAAAIKDENFPEEWKKYEIEPPMGMPTFMPVLSPNLDEYQNAIDAYVESVAALKGYKNAASCAGYINSTVPNWSAEANAFINWRDSVWVEVFGILASVQAGAKAPTIHALISNLPKMKWPI